QHSRMDLSSLDAPRGRPTNVDPKQVDVLLANEMRALSFQDRTKIQEEIHGVANLCPNETPEMMRQALHSMQEHLNAIHHKPLYDQLSPTSYIHTKEWRLKFLRCELYDCRKAAERLLRFVSYMHGNYDADVLERPLSLLDLAKKTKRRSREVMECLKTGEIQILPYRDRSGRRILVTKGVTLSRDAVVR
ncbi:MAG: hypothetical protein SGILL_008021, partial [Bacillariaceae sp.]